MISKSIKYSKNWSKKIIKSLQCLNSIDKPRKDYSIFSINSSACKKIEIISLIKIKAMNLTKVRLKRKRKWEIKFIANFAKLSWKKFSTSPMTWKKSMYQKMHNKE